MPVAANKMVYNTSASLNRVFIFELVKWVRLVLRLKILHKKGFVVLWDFRETGQSQRQTTTSGIQLGGGEITILDLCVTVFDAVFDSNLKWSNVLTTQLCGTFFEIACFDRTRRCTTSSRVR